MDSGCDRLDPNNRDRSPNYQTHNTPTTSDRPDFPEFEQADTIGREIWKFLEKGVDINRITLNLPESKRNRLLSLALFLERQEQLERRANIGQLLHRDKELIKQIERTTAELQKLAGDIKKLNNNKQ